MIGELVRVIVFAADVRATVEFYRTVLEMKVLNDEGDFVELDAGPCRLAVHGATKVTPGRTKLAFYVRDVAATRRKLEARGAKMGKLLKGGGVVLCDGQDPSGNRFQITSRR